MPDHIPEEREIADSTDIRIGAAMIDAQMQNAHYTAKPDSQLPAIYNRVKEYASRLEAVEKNASLEKAARYLDNYFRDRTPDVRVPAEQNTKLVLAALKSLVPTLSPDKE